MALLAQFVQQLALGGDDGGGIGGVTGRDAEFRAVDAGQGLLRPGRADGNGTDAKTRTRIDRDVDGCRIGVGTGLESLQGGGICNRLSFDRGLDRRIVETTRPQGSIELGGNRLGALQYPQCISCQGLPLLEILRQLLEIGRHPLVSGHREDDRGGPGIGCARPQARHSRACERNETAYARPAQELAIYKGHATRHIQRVAGKRDATAASIRLRPEG